MEIGTKDSGTVSIRVLTANDVSVTLLTEEKFNGKVIHPGPSANRVSGEHGLSMMITIKDGGAGKRHILFDTGGLVGTIVENCTQLNLKLNEVEKVILSHGHFDHFGSLTKVIPLLKEGSELYISPHCYQQFYGAVPKPGVPEIPAEELAEALKKDKDKFIVNNKLPSLNKKIINDLANEHGVKVIETSEPVRLDDGIITSGEIELVDPDEVIKGIYIMKSRKEFEKNLFRDETSIYINIKEKGLAVITGCGHCGIMNTIKHAQKITGINKVYAIIGGFHEEWNPPELIENKVKYLEELNPEITCGLHCTGFTFNKIMARHPSHTLGVAGTEFNL